MKKNLTSVLVMVMAIMSLMSGCKKSEDNPVTTAAMSATVDGVGWQGTTTSSTFANNVLNISGVASDGSSIVITLVSSLKTGTFEFNRYSFSAAVYQTSTGGEAFTSNATSEAGGTLIISEIDTANHTLTGTFEFELIGLSSGDKAVITGGVINKVTYSLN